MTEFGFVMEPSPRYTARLAARIEDYGFDIVLCPDTQNLGADPYGQLSLAAASTTHLRLGTGVTNPITRHAAVTASAVASLQMESGGRAICGIGRGDSSAAHIGKRNATTTELRDYIQTVQSYLRGEEVVMGTTASRLRWVDPALIPPAPVDVACTGPKTIRMAADVADRVSFAVGSAPERIDWALETLWARLEETGRDRKELSIGAYIILVCDPQEKRAINLARMISGLVAHFAGMKDAPVDHLPPRLKSLAVRLKTGYDMQQHATDKGSHLTMVDDEFVNWFAICGAPQKCIDWLGELIEKGLDHVYILGGSPVASPHGARWEAGVDELRLFAKEVLPVFGSAGTN
jgi:5,10-methylenetetrahydromethanopterin reductase